MGLSVHPCLCFKPTAKLLQAEQFRLPHAFGFVPIRYFSNLEGKIAHALVQYFQKRNSKLFQCLYRLPSDSLVPVNNRTAMLDIPEYIHLRGWLCQYGQLL